MINFEKEVGKMLKKAIKEMKNANHIAKGNRLNTNINGNIYFLYSNRDLKYIGERKSPDIITRLGQHLEGNSFPNTSSKWNKVKEEINKEKEITFKTIHIIPESLRTSIEEELIKKFAPEWNIQGKR